MRPDYRPVNRGHHQHGKRTAFKPLLFLHVLVAGRKNVEAFPLDQRRQCAVFDAAPLHTDNGNLMPGQEPRQLGRHVLIERDFHGSAGEDFPNPPEHAATSSRPGEAARYHRFTWLGEAGHDWVKKCARRPAKTRSHTDTRPSGFSECLWTPHATPRAEECLPGRPRSWDIASLPRACSGCSTGTRSTN